MESMKSKLAMIREEVRKGGGAEVETDEAHDLDEDFKDEDEVTSEKSEEISGKSSEATVNAAETESDREETGEEVSQSRADSESAPADEPGEAGKKAIDAKNTDSPDEDPILPEDGSLPPIVAKNVVLPMSSVGIGPVFFIITALLTAFGIIFRNRWIFKSGIPDSNVLKYIYIGLGVVAILVGGKMFLDAQFTERIGDYISSNKLCTTGVYAWTRNPIYSGILLTATGILFISGNVYMYFIPILLWAILTLLLKKTEEPVLIGRFDQDYIDYMAKVNRILPKPPAK